MAFSKVPEQTLLKWCLQRALSVSSLTFALITCIVLWGSDLENGIAGFPRGNNGPWFLLRMAFVVFAILAHCLALSFPIRGNLALNHVMKNMRDIQEQSAVKKLFTTDHVLHTIMIPNYKEDLATLRQTLKVLASHPHSKDHYDIVLAMEQAEKNVIPKALLLTKEFEPSFRRVTFTVHPVGIPGEARGKSSNLSWAAKGVVEMYPLAAPKRARRDIIVTVMDADSHLAATHFAQVTALHRKYPKVAATSYYVPPIVFDRNHDQVPAFVRLADMLWCGGGISGFSPYDPIRTPTSVYSLPLTLIERVGGWDTGSEAIGEDLHMYLKCFFALEGHLTARAIFSPASQTDVHSNEQGSAAWLDAIRSRWRQAVRHMWGSADVAFALQETAALIWKASTMARPQPSRTASKTNVKASVVMPNWMAYVIVFCRLCEAHCIPIYMSVLSIGIPIYEYTHTAEHIPHELAWMFWITGWLRFFSYAGVVTFLLRLQSYNNLCVDMRHEEMRKAGLSEEIDFTRTTTWLSRMEVFIFPIAGTIYGSLPAFHAQICQLWTLDLDYAVSLKPQRRPKAD